MCRVRSRPTSYVEHSADSAEVIVAKQRPKLRFGEWHLQVAVGGAALHDPDEWLERDHRRRIIAETGAANAW